MYWRAKNKAANDTKSHEKTGGTLRAPKSNIRSSGVIQMGRLTRDSLVVELEHRALELRNPAAQGSKFFLKKMLQTR